MKSKPPQGSIVLLPFPFSDLSSQKVRPALVLSNTDMKGDDIIVCAVTTQKFRSHSFLLKKTDIVNGKLPQDCYVRADKVVTLDISIVRKIIGTVPPRIQKQITEALEDLIS